MDLYTSIAVVVLAALVHASFQLSISVLTLLSAHTLGVHRSQKRLLKLSTGFVFGAAIMTMLLLADAVLVSISIFKGDVPQIAWTAACGLTAGVAIAIWLFYYQKNTGTTLWVPRPVANYLSSRAESTKSSAEAFGLGLSSVFAELLFIIAPTIMSGLVISQMPSNWQLAGIGIYTLMSMASLIVVWILISSGHSISKIQKWRETNKRFLQFTAGGGLIVLTFYVFINEIFSNTVAGL